LLIELDLPHLISQAGPSSRRGRIPKTVSAPKTDTSSAIRRFHRLLVVNYVGAGYIHGVGHASLTAVDSTLEAFSTLSAKSFKLQQLSAPEVGLCSSNPSPLFALSDFSTCWIPKACASRLGVAILAFIAFDNLPPQPTQTRE
jgi:hypothetical protein